MLIKAIATQIATATAATAATSTSTATSASPLTVTVNIFYTRRVTVPYARKAMKSK